MGTGMWIHHFVFLNICETQWILDTGMSIRYDSDMWAKMKYSWADLMTD